MAVGLFAVLQPARALTLVYLVGWLALPAARLQIAGFLDVDKVLATNVGALLGTLLFCSHRFRGYKVGPPDLLLLAFFGTTCISSLTNGLGVYNGMAAATHKFLLYGAPFFLGRAVLSTRRDLLEACRLVVCGAALYAVLALWEWRMSPRIHLNLYGFMHHGWRMSYRWGFWRPVVCMGSTLALGTFFMWTALLALWLYRLGKLRAVMGIPAGIVAVLPVIGLLTSMSLGPWLLFAVGLGTLTVWSRTAWHRVLILPAMFGLFWVGARYTGATDGAWLTSGAAMLSEKRSQSLQYRIDAEAQLLERAKQRPLFGWDGWGRNRVTDERGRDLVYTDGLWVLLLGSYGGIGLASFYLWWCWPLLMWSAPKYNNAELTVFGALVVAVSIQAANFAFNAFLSSVLILVCGGLVTTLRTSRRSARPKVGALPAGGRGRSTRSP